MKCNHWIATRYTSKGTPKVQFLCDDGLDTPEEALGLFKTFTHNKIKIDESTVRRCEGSLTVNIENMDDHVYDFDVVFTCKNCKERIVGEVFPYNMRTLQEYFQKMLDL